MVGSALKRIAWTLSAYLYAVAVVLGQDQVQPGRLDILTGTNKESSCRLRDLVHAKCGISSPGPGNPIPSICTCNNVFFNIWSACSYASGNNTLPVYGQWMDMCQANSIDISQSAMMTTQPNALGISVPVWGLMHIPGNTSFDLQQAVVLVHLAPKPWTIIQIVLPVVAAVVAAILTAVFLIIHRRKKEEFKTFMYSLKPVPKVHPVDEQHFGEWVIEQPPRIDSFNPPHHTLSAYRDEGADYGNRHSDNNTIPGHPSLPSNAPGNDNAAHGNNPTHVPGGRVWAEGVVPGGRVWPAGVIPPDRSYPFLSAPYQQPSGSNTNVTTSGSSGWRVRDIRIPNFWKPRPMQVQEKRPSKGFRVDGSTEGSGSVGHRSTGGHDNPDNLRSSFDIRRHAEGEDGFFEEPETIEEDQFDDEGTNLITDDQRTSYLESNRFSFNPDTVNSSSIDSHVRVVPPSTSSSESNRNTRIPSRYIPPPIVPPVPTQPAPLPPVIPARVPLRDAQRPPTSQLIPPNRFMTPIQEIDIRSPSPSLSSLSGITRRPSGDVRPLPNPTLPPHGQQLLGKGAGPYLHSPSASTSSAYDDPTGGSGIAHLRKHSGDSIRSVRPLPMHPVREDLGASSYHGLNSSDDSSFYARSPQAQEHQRL